MELVFGGSGEKEIGIEKAKGRVIVRVDPECYRPTEVDLLIGDYAKSKAKFGGEPAVRLFELVKIMTDADFKLAELEKRRVEAD